MKVAILGGGITGAVMTRTLHEAGHEVVCLEAGVRTGGLCGSETIEGFAMESGGFVDMPEEVHRENRPSSKAATLVSSLERVGFPIRV